MGTFENIKIISAGAGSGKTFRLTAEMVRFLEQGIVRPEGIIATTFTNKAAAELQERVRLKLLEKGMSKAADDLTNALIGTVHGLGVKLLKRFAYEAGVSPEVSIIADEDQQILFNQSLATVLTEERVLEMEQLCEYLGLNNNAYFDWRSEVKKLTDIARSNDFSIKDLEESKHYSVESFSEFLGEPIPPTQLNFDNQLNIHLQDTIEALQNGEDVTKATQGVLAFLRTCKRERQLKSFLPWPQWAKLSKVKPGAKSKEAVADLIAFAAQNNQHPLLHEHIQRFIHAIFDISIAALKEYDQYKKQRGLIDYIDMEVRIKELLKAPVIEQVLSEELDLLMVDEFQDTSPIQLEIFLRLSQLAKFSIWVGDPKQSIYGFRGADPQLMQAIIKRLGGVKEEDIQKYSWRSREDIVFATNALFTKAFPDIPQEQVALLPKRKQFADEESVNKENEPIEMTNALIHWHFKYEGKEKRKKQPGKPWLENCIAQSLAELLVDPPMIIPKGAAKARKAKAGDVAILCRSNSACMEMAEALHQAGLKVSISRSGLLDTTEAQLILACLKLVLNANDTLSTAEILKLTQNWSLEDIIEDRLNYLELQEKEKKYWVKWAEEQEIILKIVAIREDALELSTTETLELLLDALDLRRIIVSWGNANKRLDNVDILLQLSNQYEENCIRLYSAASLGGFLLYLKDLAKSGSDKQGAGKGEDAVEVLTYHRSKGLEWPIVICHSLEKGLRADLWGVDLVSKSEEVDLNNILGNRWIRYWVNPYGTQLRKTILHDNLLQSEAQKSKTISANQEEARLMYVGITRARDYLIFPSASNPTKWLNRVWHEGKEDYPTLDADSNESPWIWGDNILPIDTQVFSYDKDFGNRLLPPETITFFEEPAGSFPHVPYLVNLRNNKLPIELSIKINTLQYGQGIKLKDPNLSHQSTKVIKAFLTAYHKHYSIETLEEIAQDLIEEHDVEDNIEVKDCVLLGQRWWAFLEKQYPIQKDYRKYPLKHYFQGQLFSTVVDVILDTGYGLIVIQHSSFSGERKQWKNKALELADWFFLTQNALKQIFNQSRIQTYVHFVCSGAMLEVETSR